MTETTTASAIEVLGNSFSELSDTLLDAIGTVLPYALTVGGAILVVFLGWKIFKRLTKG